MASKWTKIKEKCRFTAVFLYKNWCQQKRKNSTEAFKWHEQKKQTNRVIVWTLETFSWAHNNISGLNQVRTRKLNAQFDVLSFYLLYLWTISHSITTCLLLLNVSCHPLILCILHFFKRCFTNKVINIIINNCVFYRLSYSALKHR